MQYLTALDNQCRVFVHSIRYYNKTIHGDTLTFDKIAEICYLTKTSVNDYVRGNPTPTEHFYNTLSNHFGKNYINSKFFFEQSQKQYLLFIKHYFLLDYKTINTIAYDFVQNKDLIFSISSCFYLFFTYYLTLVNRESKRKKELENLIEKYQLLDESMYIFYLIIKNEYKHYFDEFTFKLIPK